MTFQNMPSTCRRGKNRVPGVASRWVMVVLAVAVGAAGGCDSILDVELPGSVAEEDLSDPSLADAMVGGVIADFECAYNNYTFGSAAHSDLTLPSSGSLVERSWGLRNITPTFDNYVNGTCAGGGYGLWTTLQTARFQADDVFSRLEAFSQEDVPDKTSKMATVSAYGGYAYTLFGEGFCQVRFDAGPILDPDEALQIAEERFTRAIDLAQQSGNTEILNMALVGRARARLNLGDDQGAVADAQQVPQGFAKFATRDGPSPALERRWNKGASQFFEIGHHTVAPAFRDVEWKGVDDPRVDVFDTGRLGLDGVTPLWATSKYLERSTDIPLATWEEAQLIIAEAQLGQTAVGIINDLHQRAGLDPFDPNQDQVAGPTNDNILNHVIQERSRELFMEGGQRLRDMLRFGVPFPTGTDNLGNPFGDATCYPLPAIEGQ